MTSLVHLFSHTFDIPTISTVEGPEIFKVTWQIMTSRFPLHAAMEDILRGEFGAISEDRAIRIVYIPGKKGPTLRPFPGSRRNIERVQPKVLQEFSENQHLQQWQEDRSPNNVLLPDTRLLRFPSVFRKHFRLI